MDVDSRRRKKGEKKIIFLNIILKQCKWWCSSSNIIKYRQKNEMMI